MFKQYTKNAIKSPNFWTKVQKNFRSATTPLCKGEGIFWLVPTLWILAFEKPGLRSLKREVITIFAKIPPGVVNPPSPISLIC